MTDPFGSMSGFLSQFQGFLQNPMPLFAQRGINLTQGVLQNSQAAVQQLLNSGQMSQQQFNQLRQVARRIESNPQFVQMFHR